MTLGGYHSKTRVWWDGGEVSFVRWTDRSLVFSWCDVKETAVHMPRGAVLRLMEKGVLRIEGEMPAWIEEAQAALEAARKPTRRKQLTPVPRPTQQDQPPEPARRPRVLSQDERTHRVSIVRRLIRKLTGGEEPDSARVTG